MKRYSSGTQWEEEFCYSRGVRAGNLIFIAGTTSVRDGNVVGAGDIQAQARECLIKIREAVESLGGTINDIVRTRMYVTDIQQSALAGKVHAEFFRGIDPAATMVQVSGLIEKDLLIEIEAEAVLPA